MKKFILFIVVLLSCIGARAQSQLGNDSTLFDYGNPHSYEIGGVLISGTRFLDANVLTSISGLAVGDSIEVPGDKISRAIQNLWKQGLFSDIKIFITRIQGQQIFFEISVSERPRLSTFTFK